MRLVACELQPGQRFQHLVLAARCSGRRGFTFLRPVSKNNSPVVSVVIGD